MLISVFRTNVPYVHFACSVQNQLVPAHLSHLSHCRVTRYLVFILCNFGTLDVEWNTNPGERADFQSQGCWPWPAASSVAFITFLYTVLQFLKNSGAQ